MKKILIGLVVLVIFSIGGLGCSGGGGGGGGIPPCNDSSSTNEELAYQPVGDGTISFSLEQVDDHYLLTINQAQNLFGLSWDDLAGAEIPQFYGFELLTDPVIDFDAGTISFEIGDVEDLTSIWFKILGVEDEGQTLYPWNSNEDIADWVHRVNYTSLLAGVVDLTVMTVSPVPEGTEFPYSFYGPPGGYYQPVGDGTISFSLEQVDDHYRITINQAQNLFGLNWFEITSATIPNYFGFEMITDPEIDFVAGSISFEIDGIEDAESIWFKVLGQNTDDGTLYPWNNNSDIAEWVHTVDYLTMLAGEVDLTDMDLNPLPEGTVFPYQLYSPPGGVYQQMGDGTIDFTIEAVDDHYLITVTQAPNLYGLSWYDMVSAELQQVSGFTLLTDPVIDAVNGTISFEVEEISNGASAHFKLLGRNSEDNLLYPWASSPLLSEWFEVINGGTFLSIVYDAPDILPASTYNDVDPPVILGTYPADGNTDIDPNVSITITWNEMPDSVTIADHITVEGNTFGACQCNIWQDGAVTRIYPVNDLVYGETYTVTVDAEVTDLAGNQLGAEEAFSFSTPDVTVEQTRTPTWDNANMSFYTFTGNATETTYTVVNPEAGERWHVFQRFPVSVFTALEDEADLHVVYRVQITGMTFSEAEEAPEVAIQLKEIGDDYTIYSEQIVVWNGNVVVDLEQDSTDLEAGISFLFGATAGTYEFGSIKIQKLIVND